MHACLDAVFKCVSVFVCVGERSATVSTNKGESFHYPHGALTGFKQAVRQQAVDLSGDLCLHECDSSRLTCHSHLAVIPPSGPAAGG